MSDALVRAEIALEAEAHGRPYGPVDTNDRLDLCLALQDPAFARTILDLDHRDAGLVLHAVIVGEGHFAWALVPVEQGEHEIKLRWPVHESALVVLGGHLTLLTVYLA